MIRIIENDSDCDFIVRKGADEVATDYRLELARGLRPIRDLRAKMLGQVFDLAKSWRNEPKRKEHTYSVLILINPELAGGSIADEWTAFYHSVEQKYRNWLELLVWQDGALERITPFANDYILGESQEISRGKDYEIPRLPFDEIAELIKEQFKPQRGRLPQPDFYHTVATILLKNYFKQGNYLKKKELQVESGCSYPTLERALKKIDPWIERDSSRSVRLQSFPGELWWRLLSNTLTARHTVTYQDVSGQPRSIEGLIKKFQQLGTTDIAIGGVPAALHHYPKLDIVGSPRLDLIIHLPPTRGNNHRLPHNTEQLVYQIDPGLEETLDPTAPTRLAIHYLRRMHNNFSIDASEHLLADPVECLYDLHDARLAPQAEQLLNHLKRLNSTKP